MAERLQEESAGLPIGALAADILQAAKRVAEIALKSGNLKGGFVRILREAALKIEVSADAMAQKALPSGDALAQKIEALKAEVRGLREELAQVRAREGARTAPLPPDGPEEAPQQMEVEADTPKVTLPPKKDWPAAVRPPLKGVSKILSDSGSETLPPPRRRKENRPSLVASEKREQQSVESLINNRLSSFADTMREEIRRAVSSLAPRPEPKSSLDGARSYASVASVPKDVTKRRPVPEEGGKVEKRGRGRRLK
ncbi:ribonuclease Y-like [Cardiocondyla obscurior]|uniref:ribonuclease Y-like n=1 Tax=Cardiocondyla obscurior TaxID=286306 RepID=UPI00396572DB